MRTCVQKYDSLGDSVLDVAKVAWSIMLLDVLSLIPLRVYTFSSLMCSNILFFSQNIQRRLDNMLYVGLTEDHKGSATTFAHVVGAQVISQLVESNSSMEHQAMNITGQLY